MPAGLDGVMDVGAQRVGDGDEAVEDHVAFHFTVQRFFAVVLHGGQFLVGESDDAHGLFLGGTDVFFDFRLFRFGNAAHGKEAFGAALDPGDDFPVHAGDGGHVLEFGGEREGAKRGVVFSLVTVRFAAFRTLGRLFIEVEHGAFGRVAEKSAVFPDIGGGVQAEVVDQPGGGESGQIRVPGGVVEAGYGHPVFGEGAGFVGTDDVDAADGFGSDEFFDERVLSGQFDDVDRQGDGDDGRQAFGHDGDDQDDAGDEGFHDAVQCQVVVPYEGGHLDGEDDGGGGHAEKGDDFSEMGQFFLQGGDGFLRPAQLAGDFAEFGGVSGGGHDHFAVAAGDVGAGIEHVGAFGKRRFFVGDVF